MSETHTCWWCRAVVQGGVCAGPHPDYNHHRARVDAYVTAWDLRPDLRVVEPQPRTERQWNFDPMLRAPRREAEHNTRLRQIPGWSRMGAGG